MQQKNRKMNNARLLLTGTNMKTVRSW